MRLLADESVDFPIIARLRRDGHEVASIADESPGIRDELVLARAWADGVILLTGDKDFGELVYRQRLPHAGVLLFRLSGVDEPDKSEVVALAVAVHGTLLPSAFSVLTPETLRIRRSPAP